ncbi:MAG: dihydrodipicolinate synthase family protein [Rhizobiaceae bacterium]|nr:dihydrodipicolinate synthase family protein [Rhizobiaceae bacterium]
MNEWDYKGILPALQVPFYEDESIDESALRQFVDWLLTHKGITGLVTNGHTGEVFALDKNERAEVTRIVADQSRGRVPTVSGICCEGINEAVEHAHAFEEAGASGALVMPPHMWLRFGMRQEYVLRYFEAIGAKSKLDLIVHIYPSWTRASYATETLVALAKMPFVKAFKIGTRDMSKYARDVKAIRDTAPEKSILTCHDEYLLPTMVQGVDGALVGFASFIPEMITELFEAVKANDLTKAATIQERINPLKEAVYGLGEPTGDAHARMKTAMRLAGRFPNDNVRAPTSKPEGEELARIEAAVANAGLVMREAAE